MFCPKCGSQLPDGSKFCSSCGARIGQAPGPGAAAPQASGPGAVAPQAPGPGAAAPQTPGIPQQPGRAAYAPAPGVAPAPGAVRKHPRVGKGPVIVGLVAIAVVVAAVLIVRGLLGGGISDDDAANNMAFAGSGTGTSLAGYDYFYSSTTNSIMRAKGSEAAQSVYALKDDDSETVFGMTAGEGRLYFLTYDLSDYSQAIHSVKPDGTDDKVVYTLKEGDGLSLVTAFHVVKGRVYLLLYKSDSSSGYAIDVASMKTDGSDLKVESTVKTDDYARLTLADDGVYYSVVDYDKGQSAVYFQKLDGSDAKQIYSGSTQIFTVAVSGDRLVFEEMGESSGDNKLTSVKKDGSDAKTIYAAPGGKAFSMLNLADGRAYIAQYDADAYDVSQYDVLSVPVGGGDPKTLMTGVDYYNPTMTVVDGHLLLCENGQDAGSYGMRVQAIDYDGKPLATYVS